jgi:hypothetical protein
MLISNRLWVRKCRCGQKPSCAMQPMNIWLIWKSRRNGFGASSYTNTKNMPLKTSKGRINRNDKYRPNAHTHRSLPYRQLRNRLLRFRMEIRGSLPHRQLRNGYPDSRHESARVHCHISSSENEKNLLGQRNCI